MADKIDNETFKERDEEKKDKDSKNKLASKEDNPVSSDELDTESGWVIKSFLVVVLVAVIFSIIIGLLNNSSTNDSDELMRALRNEFGSQLKKIDEKYSAKFDGINIDLLDMESNLDKLLNKVNSVDDRLESAEDVIRSDKEKRAQAELKKILINIKEFSNLFDGDRRSKIGEVNDILYSLLIEEDKDSRILGTKQPEKDSVKKIDTTDKDDGIMSVDVEEDKNSENIIDAPDFEKEKAVETEEGIVEASEAVEEGKEGGLGEADEGESESSLSKNDSLEVMDKDKSDVSEVTAPPLAEEPSVDDNTEGKHTLEE